MRRRFLKAAHNSVTLQTDHDKTRNVSVAQPGPQTENLKQNLPNTQHAR
jgi:hypothetical protein